MPYTHPPANTVIQAIQLHTGFYALRKMKYTAPTRHRPAHR